MRDEPIDIVFIAIDKAMHELEQFTKNEKEDCAYIGRELALVKTKLEEAKLWIGKGGYDLSMKKANEE